MCTVVLVSDLEVELDGVLGDAIRVLREGRRLFGHRHLVTAIYRGTVGYIRGHYTQGGWHCMHGRKVSSGKSAASLGTGHLVGTIYRGTAWEAALRAWLHREGCRSLRSAIWQCM